MTATMRLGLVSRTGSSSLRFPENSVVVTKTAIQALGFSQCLGLMLTSE